MTYRSVAVALGLGALVLSAPAPSFAQGDFGYADGSGWDPVSGCRFISPSMGWGCPVPVYGSGFGFAGPGYAASWGAAYGTPGYAWDGSGWDPVSGCRFISPSMGWGCPVPVYGWGSSYGAPPF
jgi:hypothetical protein